MKARILLLSSLFIFLLVACGDDNADADDIIHYDGDNSSSPLLPPGDNKAAVYFPASLLADYEGREINTIEYFVYDLPVSARMKIYADGNGSEPGSVLYENVLSMSSLREFQWNFHVLSSPFDLNGEPIWISFEFENASDQQTIGCDAGPNDNRGGDWLNESTDGNWSTFSQRTGESINWNIRAELTK